MMRIVRNLRLSHKIIVIAVVGLAGLLAFGAIYEIGSVYQGAARATAEGARSLSDLNQRLTIGMLQARQNEKNFILRKDEIYAKNNLKLFASINRDFDELQGRLETAGLNDLAIKIQQAHDEFRTYAGNFQALMNVHGDLGLNEGLGLSGSLRAAVHDIEAKLKEVGNPELTVGMLMMRRHEKDFMLRRDAKYVSALKDTVAEFSLKMQASDIAPAIKLEIEKDLLKYQKEFLAWADTASRIGGLDAALTKRFVDMEPLLADVGKGVEQLRQDADLTETGIRDSVKFWIWIAFGLSVVLVGMTSYLIGRSISGALSAMVNAMTRLAAGDSSIAIPSQQRRDEIGEMGAAVQIFKNNVIETARLRAEQSAAEQKQVKQRKADMEKLADRFESAIGEIVETVSSASTELEASAGTLTKTAESAQKFSTMVAAASEEASNNVQSAASSSEEMASSVNEISRQVQESARIAGDAVQQARRTHDRVNQLSSAANRIGDVVELIDSVAGQTNLLALNATIEAARAGEAGRGFAVVASEVKALAEQTAKATEEIRKQIGGIQSATQDSVSAIEEIGVTIGRISEISASIAAAVEEQGAATQEVARSVQQAAEGTQQVAANITDVQRGASETGSASSQVLASAQSLSLESNRLKLEVGKFMDTVRAA